LIAGTQSSSTKAIALLVASSVIVTGSLAVAAFAGPMQTGKKQATKKPPVKTGAAPAAAAVSPQITLGKKVYADNGCGACHAISGKGGAAGPDLTTTGADPKHTPQWFEVQIATPKAHTPSSTMPEFPKIKGAEMAALSGYLVSLKGVTKPAVVVAKADPLAVAKIEKFGGSVRELAQNDPHLEVDYHMQGASVTDAALIPLAGMKSVVQLNLGKTSVTDAGLVHIKGLTNLAELHLEGTKVTDKGLANLALLKNLTYLNLYGDDVSDAGLEHLKGLTNLKNLYVWQTKVTQAGVDKLKTSIPKLDVVMGYDVPAAPPKK
jgi:mono/diheme cytochrome c family protein